MVILVSILKYVPSTWDIEFIQCLMCSMLKHGETIKKKEPGVMRPYNPSAVGLDDEAA